MTLRRLSRVLTTFAVLVGLALLGFAGHGHSHDRAGLLDQSALAFLEAGGQLSDICEDSPGDTQSPGGCPLCHLVGGWHVPAHGAQGFNAFATYETAQWSKTQRWPSSGLIDAAYSSRAPPLT